MVALCRADADPPPMIQWFKGDQMLNDGDQFPRNVSISQSSNDLTTSSQLTVMGFASEDAGVYTCVAINDLGNDSRWFEVNVIGELTVVPFAH